MAGIVQLTIDGRPVEVPQGTTILKAAEQLGIHIPTLCYHPRLEPIGACRVCVVEVQGHPRPVASCQALAEDGMVVITDSDAVKAERADMMHLVLVDHPLDCPVCDMCGECELQDRTVEIRVQEPAFQAVRETPQWQLTPLVDVVPSRCIMCGRCVAICNELQGADVLTFTPKEGFETAITVSADGRPCENCGQCISVCPVGTLIDASFRYRGRPWEHSRTETVCQSCGWGCTLEVHVLKDRIERVLRAPGKGPGRDQLCVRGQFGADFIHSDRRITHPRIRRDGELVEVSWEEALEFVSRRLSGIRENRGTDSLAVVAGDRITNETAYATQVFARQALGTRNLIGPDDQAGDALRAALGIGLAPTSPDEILEAEVVLAFGPGVETDEPLAANWIVQAAHRGARLLLAGPVEGKLGRLTRHHLVSALGDEGLVARALLTEMVRMDGGLNRARVEAIPGGADLLTRLDSAPPMTPTFPLDTAVLREFAGYLLEGRVVCVLAEGQGSTSHQAVQEILNLLLATGNLRGAGRGLVLLGGGANRRGVRDMGVSTTHLPGGARTDDPAARRAHQLDQGRPIPEQPGLNRSELLPALKQGNLRALVLLDSDPADWPGWQPGALEDTELELVVFQGQLLPDGIDRLDAVLPAARFAEAGGTMTSSGRWIGACRPALSPMGASRSDLDILSELSRRLDGPELPADPDRFLRKIAEAVPGYAGITLGGAIRGRRWPLGEAPEQDGDLWSQVPPDRPRLIPSPPPAGTPVGEGAFVLHRLRRLDEDGSWSASSSNLSRIEAEPLVRLAPADARRLGLTDGEEIEVSTQQGRVRLPARLDADVAAGFALVESLPPRDLAALGLSADRPAQAAEVRRLEA